MPCARPCAARSARPPPRARGWRRPADGAIIRRIQWRKARASRSPQGRAAAHRTRPLRAGLTQAREVEYPSRVSDAIDLVVIEPDGKVRVASRGAERRLRDRAGRYHVVVDAP